MKNITVLGSTGSVGRQTMDVIRRLGEYTVTGLAAQSDIRTMEEQIREFRPVMVCMYDEAAARELRLRVADLPVQVVSGDAGMETLICEHPVDTYVIAILGMIALKPALTAIRTGANIAIANKETLVTAGHLMLREAERCGAKLLPVDSEHSAIFQCLRGEDPETVHKLLITCSGGPFRGRRLAEMKNIRPADALAHPNWSMGAKITVDCSTLANKGLEVMEAHWLYRMPYENIQVVVHPQSIIHSMVEFSDGSVKAQLASPDMKLPIQYALYYPPRHEAVCERLDFWKLRDMTFEQPDTENFPMLALAYRAGMAGGTMPTVFNAANEWAVRRFLREELGYLKIAEATEAAMDAHRVLPEPSLETILETERETHRFLEGWKLGR